MKTKKYYFVGLAAVIANAFVCCDFDSVFAHTATLTTSGTVMMDVTASGNQANIGTDNVVVNSTCPLGYTLSIAGPTDNTLYKGGDNTNNASDQTISASSGTVATPASILGNNLGTWGYTTTSNATINSNFIGLTNTATTIATKNSASATGGDTVAVYYGASVTATTEPGLYKLAESTAGAGDNVITYYLTTSPNCNSYIIRYNDNGANSSTTMGDQTIAASATTVDLWPSNFQRSGYGFAGWNTKANGTGTNYGPMETIDGTALQTLMSQAVVENGYQVIKLYAKWVQSAGNIQSWTGCSSLASGAVTALTDTRDNNTYAVAKLADGKCWMIENLRLNNTNSDNTTGALAQGYGGQFEGLALPETANFTATTTSATDPTEANSLYYAGTGNEGNLGATINILQENYAGFRMPRYRNDNTNTDSTINPNTTVVNMTGTGQNIYSYGNYYTWSAALANTNHYTGPTATDGDGRTSENVNTSLCPAGWRLPYGRDTGNGNTPRGLYYLNYAINNGNITDASASNKLRSYPNNFVYSGYALNGSVYGRGGNGLYWSSTAYNRLNTYSFLFDSTSVLPGTSLGAKYFGRSIRCVMGEQYTIQFNANGGTGTMTSQTAYVGSYVTLSSNTFTRSGYAFDGWNTKADGTGTSYANGASVIDLPTTSGVATLYAQWACPANYVCYNDNGANSATKMGTQSVDSTATTLTLWPSNFKRSGYGFAGWNTKADGTGTNYGPMETITITAGQYSTTGLQLYAKWVQSAGNIQSWMGCSSLASGVVTALTDTRDNNTYAVAKLVDGQCWMIENLRLDNSAALTTSNTNSPSLPLTNTWYFDANNQTTTTTSNSLSAPISPFSTAWCSKRNNTSCVNQSMLSTDNISNVVANQNGINQNIYSYGNYYNWYSVTAGNGIRANNSNNRSMSGDICPTGWRLPKGGDKTRIESQNDNDFWNLIVVELNNNSKPANYSSVSSPYYNGADVSAPISQKLRSYPNNFIYSGYAFGSSISGRGSGGRYWSSTSAGSYIGTYIMNYDGWDVRPGTGFGDECDGYSARCISN